jgi:HEAT repeat protein
MDVAAQLQKLFEAERNVRKLHSELATVEPGPLLSAVAPAAREMLASRDSAEANLRLVRIAELLVDVPGNDAVDLLVDILGSTEAEARLSAGEALEERGYSRFKELALGIERALDRLPKDSVALQELPYLLAEIPEPSVTKLLARFLSLSSGETVSAAIEALVEVGDPAALKLLAPLEKDARTVDVASDAKVTVGELAREAIDLLRRTRADDR